MRRRALLSLCGVTLAGCIGDDPGRGPADGPTQEATATSDPPTGTTTSPSRNEPAGTVTGTPPDFGVPPSESDCPGDRDVTRIVCVPETDPASVPVAMTVDTRAGSLPEATFRFTLENVSEATLNVNFYGWRVWKRVDGLWFHVAPTAWPEPLHRVPPDERHTWTLTGRHALPDDPFVMGEGEAGPDGGTVSGLGGGEYAFTVVGWFAGVEESQLQFGVQFTLDGPAVELEPTSTVTGSSRDGDTVTVRGENPNADEETKLVAFVLTRVEDDPEARRVLPERAARDYRFRNTLPYFEAGVDEVRYLQRDRTAPPFSVQEPYTIRYEGADYRVRSDVVESKN